MKKFAGVVHVSYTHFVCVCVVICFLPIGQLAIAKHLAACWSAITCEREQQLIYAAFHFEQIVLTLVTLNLRGEHVFLPLCCMIHCGKQSNTAECGLYWSTS